MFSLICHQGIEVIVIDCWTVWDSIENTLWNSLDGLLFSALHNEFHMIPGLHVCNESLLSFDHQVVSSLRFITLNHWEIVAQLRSDRVILESSCWSLDDNFIMGWPDTQESRIIWNPSSKAINNEIGSTIAIVIAMIT